MYTTAEPTKTVDEPCVGGHARTHASTRERLGARERRARRQQQPRDDLLERLVVAREDDVAEAPVHLRLASGAIIASARSTVSAFAVSRTFTSPADAR